MTENAGDGRSVEIDVADLFVSIWRGKFLIAGVALLLAGAGFASSLLSPVSAVATQKITIDFPFPVSARESCGFGNSLAISQCAAGYFTHELKVELERLSPDQVVGLRNASALDSSIAAGSQVKQFIFSSSQSYSAFDAEGRAAAEGSLRGSVSANLDEALEALRTRFIADAELFASVLAEPVLDRARYTETYTNQLIAARLALQQLEGGMPRIIETGPVVIEHHRLGGDIVRTSVIWAVLGLILGTAFVVVRQVVRQWRSSSVLIEKNSPPIVEKK